MGFKITLHKKDIGTITMPGCTGLHLLEACEFADIFKQKNPKAIFSVVNEEDDTIEDIQRKINQKLFGDSCDWFICWQTTSIVDNCVVAVGHIMED